MTDNKSSSVDSQPLGGQVQGEVGYPKWYRVFYVSLVLLLLICLLAAYMILLADQAIRLMAATLISSWVVITVVPLASITVLGVVAYLLAYKPRGRALLEIYTIMILSVVVALGFYLTSRYLMGSVMTING